MSHQMRRTVFSNSFKMRLDPAIALQEEVSAGSFKELFRRGRNEKEQIKRKGLRGTVLRRIKRNGSRGGDEEEWNQ